MGEKLEMTVSHLCPPSVHPYILYLLLTVYLLNTFLLFFWIGMSAHKYNVINITGLLSSDLYIQYQQLANIFVVVICMHSFCCGTKWWHSFL